MYPSAAENSSIICKRYHCYFYSLWCEIGPGTFPCGIGSNWTVLHTKIQRTHSFSFCVPLVAILLRKLFKLLEVARGDLCLRERCWLVEVENAIYFIEIYLDFSFVDIGLLMFFLCLFNNLSTIEEPYPYPLDMFCNRNFLVEVFLSHQYGGQLLYADVWLVRAILCVVWFIVSVSCRFCRRYCFWWRLGLER